METFLHSLTPPRRAAMEFLLHHLPASDLDCYDAEMLLQFVDHALALRQEAAWCAALDEELFYHYVLFPRVNDEALSFHRAIFREALWERITACPTVEEKILEVNRWCHECASYEMQDDRTASPLTVYHAGSGRCGEESTFLVSALRSVGIAARQVYAPRWAHCDDNHAWVEALCGDTWHFFGACEPEPIPDKGWFNAPASRALLVHSRLFGSGEHPLHGEKLGTVSGVTHYNQTHRYAHTVRRRITVVHAGAAVEGALVHIQVLNEASFHTIATLRTDAQGQVFISLGQGDFHIFAVFGEKFAECDCTAGEDPVLVLDVFHRDCDDWKSINYFAPPDAPVNPAPLSDVQKHCRAEVLTHGNALRHARLRVMSSPELPAARGNGDELLAFLHRDNDPRRAALLHTLTDKDLRDATAAVLESHLQLLPAQGELPDALYFPYVACPRIALEPLTAWRAALLEAYPAQERERFCAAPMLLWDALSARCQPAESYQNLSWTPIAALHSGHCDLKSLYLLFTACLRTWGVPARLRPTDGIPEYWQAEAWHSLRTEQTAQLTILNREGAQYRRDWTLSRFEDGIWKLLTLPEQTSWVLPAGEYRLITSVRLPSGNQFAALRGLSLSAGEHKEIALLLRPYELSDLLFSQRLPLMRAYTPDEEVVEDLCRTSSRPALLFWLEEGGEPTEHLLNELLADCATVQTLPVDLIFLLRGQESLAHETLARTLAALPDIHVLFDDWGYDLEQTARHLTCDPERPPLVVALDRAGNAVYAASGYSVGRIPLLLRIADHLVKREKLL